MQDHRRIRKEKLLKLLGGQCVLCGSIKDLEFDHIDPVDKVFVICDNLTRSFNELLEEIKKCQLLCHSCHLEKTIQQFKGREPINKRNRSFHRHGTMYLYNNKCRCSDCKEWKRNYRSKLVDTLGNSIPG